MPQYDPSENGPAGQHAPTMFELVRRGKSFSGYERHCCFLNTGQHRFANVSSASGFDFPDDGRSVSLVDWDLDGDLDVWLVNRTGPQARFLRNEASNEHHFLAVRLQGTAIVRLAPIVVVRYRGYSTSRLEGEADEKDSRNIWTLRT